MNLRYLLFIKRWPQMKLANKSGYSQSLISRWVMGYAKPGPEQFKKLCQALEVSEDDLTFEKK